MIVRLPESSSGHPSSVDASFLETVAVLQHLHGMYAPVSSML